jgi:2,3-bisphosphoglycerate-independent phosphoglycerate mutase
MAGKTYLAIMCGAGDRPSVNTAEATPLEAAATPYLDGLARAGTQSLITIISDDICPESDSGAMALLSYDPLVHYTGRGPLEGLGCDFVAAGENSVSFRINFASYNDEKQQLDRRTARDLSNEELQILVGELREKTMLRGDADVSFDLMGFGRHRGIICFKSAARPLSGRVSNTDPGFINVGPFGVPDANPEPRPKLCVPLVDDSAAACTADLINRFVVESAQILQQSSVNRRRIAEGKLPANILLFRDGGDQPAPMQPFTERFDRSLSFYGQIPAEKGLMSLVGGRFSYCRLGEREDEGKYLEETAAKLLRDDADVVAVHLKGADEPGHDGRIDKKTQAIELIDRHFIRSLANGLDSTDVCIITSDHATPCELRVHSADPVPALVCGRDIVPDRTATFCEREASHGGLPVRRAIELLPHVFGRKMDQA